VKSFSEAAARLWSKDHVRQVLDTVRKDIQDLQFDLEQETRPYNRGIMREKLDDLREERDFLEDLLK